MSKVLEAKRESIINNPVFRECAGYFYEGEYSLEGPPEEFIREFFTKVETVMDMRTPELPEYKEVLKGVYNLSYPNHPPRVRKLAHKIIDTSLQPDHKTNIYPKGMEEFMIILADFHASKAKAPVTLIGADYCNLGGFFAVMGNDRTSEFVNLSAALVRNTLRDEGVDLVQMTNLFGTDELNIIVKGETEKIRAAMGVVRERVKKLIKDLRLDNLEHAKHLDDLSSAGVNIAFGMTELGGVEAFSYERSEAEIEKGIDKEKETLKNPERESMIKLSQISESARPQSLLSNTIERYRDRVGEKMYKLVHHVTSPVALIDIPYENEDGTRMLPEEALPKKIAIRLRQEIGEDWEDYLPLFKSLIFVGRYDPHTGLKNYGTFRNNYHDIAEDGCFTEGGYLSEFNLRNTAGLNCVFCHHDTNSIFEHAVKIMREVAEEHSVRYVSYRTGGKSFRLIVLGSDKQKMAAFTRDVNNRFEDEVNQKTVGEYMEAHGISSLQGSAIEAKVAGAESEDEVKAIKIADIPHKRDANRKGVGLGIVSTSIAPSQRNVFFPHGTKGPPVEQIISGRSEHKGHVFAVKDMAKFNPGHPVNSSILFENSVAYMCLKNGGITTINLRKGTFAETARPGAVGDGVPQMRWSGGLGM